MEMYEAGPDLDALVAREIMGWDAFGLDELWHVKGHRKTCITEWGTAHAHSCTTNYMWRPSTEISGAWKVVETLRKRYGIVQVHGHDNPESPGAENENSDLTFWECIVGDDLFFASAGTPELAICRAAMEAVTRSAEEVRK